MSEAKRVRLGILAVVVGGIIFTVGFMAVHFTGLSETNSVGQEIYPHIPRGWVWVTLAKIVALVGSQILIIGIVFGWLFDREMTWARASVGAAIFVIQILVFFAIIPNEWLGLTQGEFEWTSQKEAFKIPSFLVLNNNVSISFGAIKDIVSGGYSATMLGAMLVGMYQYQEWNKRRGEPKPPKTSGYGRPLVKGAG